MKIKMKATYGNFEAGKTYDIDLSEGGFLYMRDSNGVFWNIYKNDIEAPEEIKKEEPTKGLPEIFGQPLQRLEVEFK